MPRPLHMLVEIPPKYSVFSFMGYFKEKSGLTIYEKYPKVSINRNRKFWCRGHNIDTAGKKSKENRGIHTAPVGRRYGWRTINDGKHLKSPFMGSK